MTARSRGADPRVLTRLRIATAAGPSQALKGKPVRKAGTQSYRSKGVTA
jgi:hypothetical protein